MIGGHNNIIGGEEGIDQGGDKFRINISLHIYTILFSSPTNRTGTPARYI